MTIFANYVDLRTNFTDQVTTADDGYLTWNYALVDASGFTGLTLPTNALTLSFPFTVTTNANANDTTPYVDLYDWHLCQPGNAAGRTPLLSISRSDALPNTRSGTVSIDRLDGGSHSLPELFQGVTIYVKRLSDGALQVGEFYASLYGA